MKFKHIRNDISSLSEIDTSFEEDHLFLCFIFCLVPWVVFIYMFYLNNLYIKAIRQKVYILGPMGGLGIQDLLYRTILTFLSC